MFSIKTRHWIGVGVALFSVTTLVSAATPALPGYAPERTFPTDTGMINVKSQYGAAGDGHTDDTAAIQRAISENIQAGLAHQILYFPQGTYLISAPLVWKNTAGVWQSYITLQGENQQTTSIKLTDNNALYQSTSPVDVITMGNQNPFNSAGGGYDGFDNFIFDLTIDSGKGNPAAVALNFQGNNYCGIRNVTLQSSDPQYIGQIGLSAQRYATGPCLMKNLTIHGFNYGIRTLQQDYSITFNHLVLDHQRVNGILNVNNILSIRDLISVSTVPAIVNSSANGLVTLIDSSLTGGTSATSAIDNKGALYARHITSSGYGSALQNAGVTVPGSSIAEYVSAPVLTSFAQAPASALNLPIDETPEYEDSNLGNWKNVVSFGADPTGARDSAAAIQAAIDAGGTTVYFPSGKYLVNSTIIVRGNVRMLNGFSSWIQPNGTFFNNNATPQPLFKIAAGNSATADVTLNHFRMGNWQYSYAGVIFVLQDSPRPVVLRDSDYAGSTIYASYQNTVNGTGTLFIDDLEANVFNIVFPQNVFACQLNPENVGVHILNNGGKLWILGLKTEHTGTNIETDHGGSTEVLGGLVYPLSAAPAGESAFVIKDSQASFTYGVSDYGGKDFATQVTETQGATTHTLPTASVPSRGNGVMVALYSSVRVTGSTPPVTATLSVAPTALSFSGSVGSNPAPKTLAISDPVNGTSVPWSVTSNASWLTFSPGSGTSVGGAAGSVVTVTPDVSGLAAATYTGALTITGVGTSNAPQTVTVIMILKSTPTIVTVSVSPAGIQLGAGQMQQFSANVTGSTVTTVTWSLSPSMGTLTNTGLYTAPATIVSPQSVLVKATSVADPSQGGQSTVQLTLSTGQIPAPDLGSLDGKTFPLNTTIAVNYTSPATGFLWSLTPIANSAHTAGSPVPNAAVSKFPTPTAQLGLGTFNLLPGAYTLSVEAVNGSQVSAPATATITLAFADLTKVRVYPNPWSHDKHAAHPMITFDQMAIGSTVNIFTVSGHKIRELDGSSGGVTWDLNDTRGNRAASGIYIYLIKDAQGNKSRGKLAILR